MLGTLMQDVRFALRSLARTPSFAFAAIAALILGIGGTTAIYSVVDTLLVEPLPFPNGDRLVMFWDENPREGRTYNEVTPAHVRSLQRATATFDDVGAYDLHTTTLAELGEPEQLAGAVAESRFFTVLDARAAAGRLFTPDDDRPGAPPVAILSHEFLTRRFGGDRSIVGRTLSFDGTPTTIVGVLPAGFRFEFAADVYMPLGGDPAFWDRRDRHSLRVVGRLAPGVSLPAAQTAVAGIAAGLEREFPETNRGWTISVVPATEGVFQGPVRPALIAFLGGVGFVLLIACANVANLLFARVARRRREFAIRATLGARPARLTGQLLVEALLLATIGALGGLVFADWALGAIIAMAPPQILLAAPRLATLRIDGSVLAFTAAVTLTTVVLCGLLPSLRAGRADVRDAINADARAGGDRRLGRMRAVLVGAEVALAMMLLTGAGLMIRSFENQTVANPGMRPDGLLTFSTALTPARYPTGASIAAFQRAVLADLRDLPGVDAAAGASAIPLTGNSPSASFTIRGSAAPGGAAGESRDGGGAAASLRFVSDGYFEILGIPVLNGRAITARDEPGSERVAVVSEGIARRYFGGRDPIGAAILLEGDTVARVIVGVVGNVRDWKLGRESDAFLYLPFQQARSARMGFMLRTAGDPAALTAGARSAIARHDPAQPIYDVQPMNDVLTFALFTNRLTASLLGTLAVIALVLAMVGVYGVVAYTASQRTREVGIRMALGARRTRVVLDIVRHGMTPVVLGLALGTGGALLLTQGLSRMLYGVSATDPATYGAVAGVLALTAGLACLLPARRAARADPMVALRNE